MENAEKQKGEKRWKKQEAVSHDEVDGVGKGSMLERKDENRKRSKRKKRKSEEIPVAITGEDRDEEQQTMETNKYEDAVAGIRDVKDIAHAMEAELSWWRLEGMQKVEEKCRGMFSRLSQLEVTHETGLFDETEECLKEWLLLRKKFEKKKGQGAGGLGEGSGHCVSRQSGSRQSGRSSATRMTTRTM